jgi:hypothetical protein
MEDLLLCCFLFFLTLSNVSSIWAFCHSVMLICSITLFLNCHFLKQREKLAVICTVDFFKVCDTGCFIIGTLWWILSEFYCIQHFGNWLYSHLEVNHLKAGVVQTSRTSCISHRPQTVDSVQYSVCVICTVFPVVIFRFSFVSVVFIK